MAATIAQVWKEFESIFVAVGKTTVSRSSSKVRQGNSFTNDYVRGQDLYSSEFLQRE